MGLWLLSWLALSLLLSALFTGLLGLMGTYLVLLAGDSFGILLLVLSAFALLGAAMTFVLTWCSSSLLDQVHMEGRTEVMAHRGASGRAPENTLAAIQAAIEDGADWVEIDVQEMADGAVVVIHDRDLKKIAGKAMAVANSTLADLQKVDVGSWFGPKFSDQRIPTLKQVLQWCKGKIGVNVELKYYGRTHGLEESVAEIVDASGMQDQVLLMQLADIFDRPSLYREQ